MISNFFIERPIFTTVLSLIIVIAGFVSLRVLPIAQYPTITPVQIQVTAFYPGADAKTVAEAVAAPIEAQINGVENMLYMTSTSSNSGQTQISVFFTLDTDPDMAQVLVQNRVNLALPQLPDSVRRDGVNVQKLSSTFLMIIAVFDRDGRYSNDYVNTYTNVHILDAIKRINGAGQARIFGIPDQAMRIWTNPDRMASLGITTTDLHMAISGQNRLVGAGQIGQSPSPPNTQLTFPVSTQKPYTDPHDYENIILKAYPDESAIVRVGDVARAVVGRKQYITETRLNNMETTALAVYQQAGANGLDVSRAVKEEMERLKTTMPEGLDYVVALDTTDFVQLSIEEVQKTLFEALILVTLIVYLFLQNFRATLICLAAIIVSIVGAFTGLLAFGFSINLLTLFAIVLVIGTVVDDAIIIVENIERNMAADSTLTPKNAAIRAMEEMSSPVIAVCLVIASVFIPAAFLPGTTGQLYRQFALTIVVAVGISGFVALTLTPALSGVFLKAHTPSTSGFFGWFNRLFANLTTWYGKSVAVVIQKATLFILLFGVMTGLIVYLFATVPTSFVPNEDQGYVIAQVILPDAASLERTSKTADKLEEIFRNEPAVANRTVVSGFSLIDGQSQSNMATLFVTLKPFAERYANLEDAKRLSARAVLQSVAKQALEIEEAITIPIAPPAIPGIGTTGGFEFWIQSFGESDTLELSGILQQFLEKARASTYLTGINSTFRASSLQLTADVDRNMTRLLNVDIDDVYNAIEAQFGSLKVSQYEQFSRVWDVIIQSDAQFRQEPSDITRLYTRSRTGEMVPLSAVVTTKYSVGSSLIPHFNGVPAAQITGSAAAGYSSGDAIREMERIAKEVLPPNYSFSWAGMALQEKTSGQTSLIAFGFGILIIFLILAAQYESWSLPLTVLTAVPFGVIGALIATYLRGLDNDVYFQIGLLVLVGLAAKNAILIVEFAVELQQKGYSVADAARSAGELRLRPIIMTSLTFIFGVIPLFIAMGAGANARHSIGTGIIGGMIGASTLALIYVPLFYCLLDRAINFLNKRKDDA